MSGPVPGFKRLSKLRTMSPGEVLERVRYKTVLLRERRRHGRMDELWPDRLRRALGPSHRIDWRRSLLESRRVHSHRFLAGVHDRALMQRVFDQHYQAERESAGVRANEVLRGQFTFFGRTFSYGEPIDWQADPVSRRPWPARFHADVPVHGGDVGHGDVKYVWELSRQQYLIDLAKAYFLDDDGECLGAVRDLVRSWIAGNPVGTGVNWACALEPAFRSFSWMWAYYLSLDGLDDEFHLEWLCGFHDHARFIETHLEWYSSPYNHLIGEASALYMLGACFPEFRDAPRWRTTGRRVLEGRLSQQFYTDGGSVEQSTFYHHATVGYYLLAGLTARAVGDDFAPAVWQAIERGIDYSLALVQPDGRTPEIGGADDGKPIRMEHLPFWDFRPYQAIGAVLFRRADFKTVASRFHEDALWLLGPDGLREFERLPTAQPAGPSRALPASGYYVLRSDWSPSADYVCFDCGEQAAGMRTDAVPNSMHGHADCLSVVVWLGGTRVLVDSGLFAYNCGGAWEAHFRETAAHNTARVDGRDQARHLGKMAWSHSYRPSLEAWSGDGQGGWVIGSHDGYARGPSGVTHRRAVWLRDNGWMAICDEFTGRGDHELEVNFQFAPGEVQHQHQDGLVFDGVIDVVWAGSVVWTPACTKGGGEPDEGWFAPSLGVREPAPRLTLRCRSGDERTTLLTVLARRRTDAPRATLRAAGQERGGRLIAVDGVDRIEWVGSSDISAGTPLQTDALLAVCQVRAGGAVTLEQAGGARVSCDPGGLGLFTIVPARPIEATP